MYVCWCSCYMIGSCTYCPNLVWAAGCFYLVILFTWTLVPDFIVSLLFDYFVFDFVFIWRVCVFKIWLYKYFIYFNWRIITLQNCGGFFHTSTWINHRCTCVPSILNTPSHIPRHPIPLGCLSTPALSALLHASNLQWSSISHMIIYMFQCYSLKSSHPRLLLQSPKVCFVHLCLFCCLAYRIVITIFLSWLLLFN